MTTTPPQFDFHLSRPGALIAALPAVLGFVPQRSLVLVTLDRSELGCVLRADLGDHLPEKIEHLAEVAASAGADAVIAVVVDEDCTDCQVCEDRYHDLAVVLEQELDRNGVDLYAVHVVDRVASGGFWRCPDGCGEGGPVDDPESSPMAAAAVLDGRRLYATRDELLQVIRPDPVRSAALNLRLEPAAGGAADPRKRPDAEVRRDIEAALRIAVAAAEGREPDTDELVQLAAGLTDPRVRDTLYALAVGECAAAAEELWAHLSRNLPDPWRVEALVLLAFSAYSRGDGPLAGVSLDAALRSRPMHRMAGMLDTALQSGMHPQRIRELAVTGYRLAGELGVELPARQMWGRRAG